MTDAELRAIVRAAVARHLGQSDAPASAPGTAHRSVAAPPEARGNDWHAHASHHLYVTLVNADGACVIEPTVACDHCGYCKSHGH